MTGLTFVLAILGVATVLVVLDLVLLARREWHKARVRALFQQRLRADLARDAIIHDKQEGKQLLLQLKEEADDYLDLMAMRDTQLSALASAQTGNFDTRAYQ